MKDAGLRHPDETEAEFHARAAELHETIAREAHERGDILGARRAEKRAASARERFQLADQEAEQREHK